MSLFQYFCLLSVYILMCASLTVFFVVVFVFLLLLLFCVRLSLCVCACVLCVRSPVFVCLPETERFHSTLHGCTRKPSRGCEVSSGEWSQSEHSNRGTKDQRETCVKSNLLKSPIRSLQIHAHCVSFVFCFS